MVLNYKDFQSDSIGIRTKFQFSHRLGYSLPFSGGKSMFLPETLTRNWVPNTFLGFFAAMISLAFCQGMSAQTTSNSQVVSSSHSGSQVPAPKNVLFIFADDQRQDTISAWGNPGIDTPNLDRLVRRGVSFRNTHCFGSIHGAVCQPSRAMLHSGRSLFNISMDMSNAPLLGELLGQAGYQTFGTGKWHNGRDSFARSFQKGRNIMFGGMSDHTKVPVVDMFSAQMEQDLEVNPNNPKLKSNRFSKVQSAKEFSSEAFVDSAIGFLRNDRVQDQPFFCYVALTAPHDPRQPPEDYRNKYYQRLPELPKNFLPQHPFDNGELVLRDEVLAAWPRDPETIRQQLAEYYGLVDHMDHQIGRLLSTLQELNLEESTLVVFTADHGLAVGSHGLLGKQNLYQHSMGTPLIISGPGISQQTDRQQLIYLFDLMPTVLDWCGLAIPEKVEGTSVLPMIQDAKTVGREYLFTAYRQSMRSIRDQRWKLIVYPEVNVQQLFDLQEDPNEMNNLVAAPIHQALVERLWKAMETAQVQYSDKAPLSVENPKSKEVDLSKVNRKPDQWQPKWIVEKYFPPQPKASKK